MPFKHKTVDADPPIPHIFDIIADTFKATVTGDENQEDVAYENIRPDIEEALKKSPLIAADFLYRNQLSEENEYLDGHLIRALTATAADD